MTTTWDTEDLIAKLSDEQFVAHREEILAKAMAWSKYTDKTDAYRNEEGGASTYGGFELRDAA